MFGNAVRRLLLLAACLVVAPAWADKAYTMAVQAADARIGEFTRALKAGDAQATRQAALALRQDPMAISRLNQFGSDALKRAVNREIQAVEQTTRELARQRLASQLNVSPDKIVFFEATNPSGQIKVGQDWDVTARVEVGEVERLDEAGRVVKEKIYKDIRIKDSARSVQEAYFEAATGKARPTDPKAAEKYAQEAAEFAHQHNLEVTDYLASEAYGGRPGEGEAIIKGPKNQRLRDVEQLSQVMEYKSNLARNKAQDLIDDAARQVKALGLEAGDPRAVRIMQEAEAAAQGWYQEQARQYVKQFDRQIAPRVEALGGKVPARVDEGTQVLRRLAAGEISPAEARLQLKAMGQTIDDVIRKGTGLVEAAQKAKTIMAAVNSAAAKGGAPAQALRKLLPQAAKGAGVVATVLPAAGSLSHGYRVERERAAMENRGIDNWEAFDKAFKHAVTEPAKMVADLFGQGVEAGGEAFYRLSKEKGVAGAFGSSFSNALWYAGSGALWGAGKVAEGVGYTVSNPLESGAALMHGGLKAADLLGQVLLVDEIAANLYYDPEATRAEFAQLRQNAARYAEQMAKAVERAEGLQAALRQHVATARPESKDFASKAERLATDYRAAYAQASGYVNQWYSFVYRRYGGLENPVVAEENHKLLPVVRRIQALPADPFGFIDQAFLKGLPSNLAVRVKDGTSGKPIGESGWLQLNGPGFERVCDGRGPRLTCAGIPPGEHRVRVNLKGYEPVELELKVHPLKQREYELQASLTKQKPVPTHARVSVQVVDAASGAPIHGATVRIRSPEGDSQAGAPKGSLSFQRVARGTSTIEAEAPGYLSSAQSLAIDPARQTDYAVTLRLSKGVERKTPAALTVRVRDARSGQPIAGASVVLSGAASASASGATPTLTGLAPGSYRIEVSASGYLPGSDSITLASGARSEITIGLQPLERKAQVNEESERADKAAAAQKCFEPYRKKIAELRAHNQRQDPASASITTVTLGADRACSAAYSACIEAARQAARQCPPGPDGTYTQCFRKENAEWIRCAMEEISCGEAALMRQCGLK
ncbi:carboxypeptidase family protein [Sulfuritortus calidifontis]|uniref:Carboxypeptidase family protein n=1 Tax=Sulfuritortus calidifontis TaxID=1914471 RepID=A0A4R3JW58_9PROT|nr:carboxypeptidase regulatory-like domain-containing protein [Sulfuritortus calidifontis]TCS72446.1 carboxypeptidase family protein [Sulfuritortus calidifontis]